MVEMVTSLVKLCISFPKENFVQIKEASKVNLVAPWQRAITLLLSRKTINKVTRTSARLSIMLVKKNVTM